MTVPKIRRADLFLTVGALALAAALFFLKPFSGKGAPGPEGQAGDLFLLVSMGDRKVFEGRLCATAEECFLQGETSGPELLSPEGRFFRVSCGEKEYNRFEILTENGTPVGIRCVEATCPDHICVETGSVTSDDRPVVCLPHRLTVRLIFR